MTIVRILLTSLLVSLVSIAHAAQPTVLVVGDSLSAGYGIDVTQGWVSLLQKELTEKKAAKVINASVSGETTSGGLTRLPALLENHKPQIVIIELGGNDGLRGQPVKIIQQNLQTMISKSQEAGAKVLLVGMQIPSNYGPRYTKEFREIYSSLAEKNKTALVTFLLEGVAMHADLIQRDGIHPTAEAQPIILKNVLPVLVPML